MANTMKLYARFSFAPLLALAMLFPVAASGQTPTPAPTPAPIPAPNPNPDQITSRDIAEMNQFLDSHPEIREQLRKDPSLIDNRGWVADHPALQEYLQNHRQMADAFRANPNLFMRDEDHYRQDDISRKDLEDMSHFLNTHPEIAEQLRKDPALIDNKAWVANHPALQEYLQTHIQVADAFRAHPDAFMRDEERDDKRFPDDNRVSTLGRDDRNRGELTSFGQFLGGHSNIAAELSGDPTLANNKEYLANHPELDEYLKAHPTMSQQLAENPQAVMTSNAVQQSGFVAKPVGPTKRPPTSAPNNNQ
jgi:hypothetical protein